MNKRVLRLWCAVLAVGVVAGTRAFAVTAQTSCDGVARVMAGMDPSELGLAVFTSTPPWTDHRAFFEKNWAELSTKRLDPARVWCETEVKPDASLKTLFYPFSGPDFLNAYLFFPNCDT